ncbi:MAG: hypothetical protein UZ21_OP11001000889 [Microgenomates bacterium OLB22]|nr:MAG: hypothetical protein UZ21_OP11001000889 [Microgenomates bacterium OLB22]
MAPLIYLIGLYFEQLALITELNDRGKHQLVLLTCCEAFGLDWQEFIPKGWPEISQHIDAWLEEFSALQNT